MSKRFRASIRFMLASEGGRTQNAMSGYHPQFKLGDIYTSCIIRSVTTDEVFELGREYEVELEFMFWDQYGHLVREDMPIELYEGSRLVGTGKFQKLLIYDNSKQNFQIENPSPVQIKELIDAMDNHHRTGFTLQILSGILTVVGGNNNRVVVGFGGRRRYQEFRWGKLTDPSYTEEDGEIDISADGDVNSEPLYLTVTKEVAYQVSVYFLENDAFPSDLVWQGRMS